MSFAEEEELRKQVTELEQESESEFASPVLFVRKPDGSQRMCVDYRKLNAMTLPFPFPVADAQMCFDRLASARVYSRLDLKSGFWQMRVKEEHQHLTAFSTPFGLYQYAVAPFGLRNSPSYFARLMTTMLRAEIDAGFCTCFVDDIIIHSLTVEEHRGHLVKVLEALRKAKLYVARSKCVFFQSSVQFLGFVVGGGNITTDPEKVQAVEEFPMPTTLVELRRALGLFGFYRRFVKGYADIAPTTDRPAAVAGVSTQPLGAHSV